MQENKDKLFSCIFINIRLARRSVSVVIYSAFV